MTAWNGKTGAYDYFYLKAWCMDQAIQRAFRLCNLKGVNINSLEAWPKLCPYSKTVPISIRYV